MDADASGDTGSATPGCVRYVFANVEFDEWLGRLRVDGELVEVEPRPLRLLAELLRRVNEVLTKEELLDAVWQGRPTVDHVLANAVSKLRMALGPAGAGRLATLPRVGYRFSGPVQRLPAGGADSAFETGQTLVGRDGFVLDRLLGQGGNSDVWLARHAKLGQSHVFKLATDGPRLAALKREFTLYRLLGQTLGPRPDIARILDANFQSAPFFLECEYGGRSLLEWADDGNTLLELSVAERLGVFLQVARAVAAAHSVGVLHKDLKPGNVLIDGQRGAWVVKLTDFGSGRLLEPERLAELRLTALGMTQAADAGASSGRSATGSTLMYMAPELLAGQAPTLQSDVYSLGVMLFQLLVGDLRRHLSTGWQQDVDDPLLCDEIEAATQGAPARRTASVANVVDNLSRVDERRQERALQTANAAIAQAAAVDAAQRRARLPWLVAGVVGLVIGLVVSVFMAVRAERARTAALQAQAQTQAVSDFLHHDVMETPDVLTSGGVRPLQLMDLMRQASRNAGDRFRGQPLAEAVVRRRIAETYLRRAAVAEAMNELSKARKLLVAAQADDSTEGLMLRFLGARALLWARQVPKARELLAEAEQSTGAARMAAATELGAATSRARLEFMLDAGQAREAVPLALRLVQQVDQIRSPQSPHRVDARQRLAETYLRAGLDTQAEQVFAELAKPPLNAPGMAGEYKARALVVEAEKLASANRFDEAHGLVQQARALLGPAATANLFYLAFVEYWDGACELGKGRPVQARRHFTAAMTLIVESIGTDHVYIEMMRHAGALAALEAGQATDAAAMFEQVDRWYRNNVNELGQAASRFGRVAALTDLGQPAAALELLDAIPAHNLAQFDPAPGLAPRVSAERARALLALGRAAEAKPMLRQAVLDMKAAQVPAWKVSRYERLL